MALLALAKSRCCFEPTTVIEGITLCSCCFGDPTLDAPVNIGDAEEDCPFCTIPGLGRDHDGPCAQRMWHDDDTPCEDPACDRRSHRTQRDIVGAA